MKKNESVKNNVEENVAVDVAAVDKKYSALQDYLSKSDINGMQFLEVDEHNKGLRTNFLVEGQTLPVFVVVNETVYSYIQVHLVTITPDKLAKCLPLLNELNDSFTMLKYGVNKGGNIILTCSIPAGDDKFDPAIIFALLDKINGHLQEHYKLLMKKIWEEQD